MMSLYIALKQLAAGNWPVELVYLWFTEFSMSHMVDNNGNLTWWLGIRAFINEDAYINKDVFIYKGPYSKSSS